MAVAQEYAVPDVTARPQTGVRAVAVIVTATLGIFVDGTASATITAGLPYVQGVAAATPDESSWFVSAFNAPYYATVLFSPWLYARFGRKPLLLFGLAMYGLTSLLLALSTSYSTIVALRFFEGLSLGCVFVPVVILFFTSLPLAILRLAVPSFALLVLTAGALGTLIGGYLSETYGAGAIFIPSAFAALIAAFCVWEFAPAHDKPQSNLKPDVFGYALALLFFFALQYLSNEGERRNWFDDPNVVQATFVLALSLAAFIMWELVYAHRPLAHLRLFTMYRNLAVGGTMNLVLGVVGYSVTLFSIYLQTSIASTITLAGEVIALRTLTYIFGVIFAFILLTRRMIDVRILVAIATVGTALCLYGFALSMTPTAEAATFVGVTLVFGFFFAMLNQPIPSLVIGSLPMDSLPHGIAIYKLTVPIGAAIGTALIGTFVDHRATFQASHIAANLTLSSTGASGYVMHGGSLARLGSLVLQQAQTVAYRDAMTLLCGVVLLLLPLVIFAIPPTPPPPPPAPSK